MQWDGVVALRTLTKRSSRTSQSAIESRGISPESCSRVKTRDAQTRWNLLTVARYYNPKLSNAFPGGRNEPLE